MSFILKKPQGKSKGILIFTHKEILWVFNENALLRRLLFTVKNLYLIGLHWGHYHENVGEIIGLDFHLAGPGTLKLKEGVKARRIDFCSRNFAPSCFKSNENQKKFWDIITIGRPIRLKNLREFFESIRICYDQGRNYRVLAICPCMKDLESNPNNYQELVGDYHKMFSDEEREKFQLMLLDRSHYPFPLSAETLAYFYSSSRLFTLFSDQEGESRVISEALLCGLPVVVKAHLRGGGRDFLDHSNSILFDGSPAGASNAFTEVLENYTKWNLDNSILRKNLSEDYSTQSLVEELQKVYNDMELPFEGEMDLKALDRKLPSHILTLPPSLRLAGTNDLKSSWAAAQFLAILAREEIRYSEFIYFETLLRINNLSRRARNSIVFRLKAFTRRIAKNF